MALSPANPSFLLLFLLLLSSPLSLGLGSSSSFSSPSNFLSTLRSTIDQIQEVTSLVSTFSDALGGGDLRLSSAVSDCLDLLDLSSDELTRTLSASQPSAASTAAVSGTGNRLSDLRAWMSAALGNQDTCKEGLDSTDGILGSLIAAGLEAVTSLVSDGLGDIAAADVPGGFLDVGKPGRRRLMKFPEWVSVGDRRLLQAAASTTVAVDAVVAQDGSGNYTTVGAAVAAAPNESARRYVIYLKKGVYYENVEVKKKKWNLMIVGDGMGQTIISGSRNFVDGWTTYRSATFAVAGIGFIARDLTIENTAGPEKHQAVALRSDSDLSVFYQCSFLGYQDTLYAHSLRQFYRDCLVAGTVDFVFGNAAAVFQNCSLLARRPLADQKNSVTAHGRKDPNQSTGFSFQFCNVSAAPDLAANRSESPMNSSNSAANRTDTATAPTYLGRPWKEYSRTVFMQSYIGAVVRPEGWLEWDGDFALSTLYYGEYMNYGPGSELRGRVRWPGYHAMNNSALAYNFTVSRFIEGNLWLPSTGVKYTAGLIV